METIGTFWTVFAICLAVTTLCAFANSKLCDRLLEGFELFRAITIVIGVAASEMCLVACTHMWDIDVVSNATYIIAWVIYPTVVLLPIWIRLAMRLLRLDVRYLDDHKRTRKEILIHRLTQLGLLRKPKKVSSAAHKAIER